MVTSKYVKCFCTRGHTCITFHVNIYIADCFKKYVIGDKKYDL